jgi:hypothetical protein
MQPSRGLLLARSYPEDLLHFFVELGVNFLNRLFLVRNDGKRSVSAA